MRITSLRSQPRVAREIGYLTMYAANLEVMFLSILTALLDDDPRLPVSISEHIQTITPKLRILFDVAAERPKDRLAKAICDAQEDIEKSIAFRNKLAHGLFVFDEPTGRFELASGFVSGRRGKPICEPLTVQMVKENAELLRKAISRIIRAGGHRLRNPMEVP